MINNLGLKTVYFFLGPHSIRPTPKRQIFHNGPDIKYDENNVEYSDKY